jgi:simple sugar transport system ATP-binding protein
VPTPDPGRGISVELRGITKRYPGTLALDAVDLVLRPGEVRALLGENGAGKSTLTGVLFGHVRPDRGEILVGGAPVAIRSPAHALELGIGLVHQHFALAPSLTVAENVVLGETRRLGAFDRARVVRETRELAARVGLAVDPEARTGDLPVGVRQRVEILKVLRRDVKVLLLDEPTAVLAPREVDELFAVIARLRAEGRSVLFITHKLREVARAADRVTILRHGKVVAPDLDARATPPSELAGLMIGEAGSPAATPAVGPREARPAAVAPREARPGERVLLALEHVTARGPDGRVALRDVSLEVRAGEIVGVAGVAGNGQDELFLVAAGLLDPGSGRVARTGSGIATIPGDRHAYALATGFTCAENLSFKEAAAGPFVLAHASRTRGGAGSERARELMERFDVRPADPGLLARDLSGGNQQKLVLARELSARAGAASPPELVLALDPARGLDVTASERVAAELVRAADRGAGVLLVSTDLDEVLALATRAFALHAGALHAGPLDRDALGLLMLGGAA